MAATRIETFRQMLEADPENTMVQFGLANEYIKAERYEEAITALTGYLERADDEGAAYGMLARALEKVGRRDEARRAFEQGILAAESHGHPSMAEDYRFTLSSEYDD